MARRSIQVHDDTWELLYQIKGSRRTFEAAILDLINRVYPMEKESADQVKLRTCPSCGEFSLCEDEDGVLFCQNEDCGYEVDEGEIND